MQLFFLGKGAAERVAADIPFDGLYHEQWQCFWPNSSHEQV